MDRLLFFVHNTLNFCLMWKMSYRKWWVSRRNHICRVQQNNACFEHIPCFTDLLHINSQLQLWMGQLHSEVICTFYTVKYISDIIQWLTSHSYHSLLPRSSCLSPKFHVCPVSSVVMRNNWHQKQHRNLQNHTNSWKVTLHQYTKAESEATHLPSLHHKQGTFQDPILRACRAHCFFLCGLLPGVKILCASPQFLICFALHLLINFPWTTMQTISYFIAKCIDLWNGCSAEVQ